MRPRTMPIASTTPTVAAAESMIGLIATSADFSVKAATTLSDLTIVDKSVILNQPGDQPIGVSSANAGASAKRFR